MAITKILNINCATEGNPAAHLKNALEYIQNPDKTEQCHLVGSVNCLPDTAYEQMLDTKSLYGKSGKRQGYHVIISFPPDEAVTPELAKMVAEGFIGDILNGEYETVYGIHTDKEHTHVHIIWNSVNLITGQKYNSPKGNWKHHLQPATNKYCEMLGLEIMPAEYAKEPVNMSKEKWEYEQSFKDYILDNARLCLSYAGSLEHFIFLMKRMGYEFKGKDYLSVRIPGMKLYHRLDKLDTIFSKEELPAILKYGYGQYYRRYNTKSVLYVKRANLTSLQKKYYAKMYRLGLIEKKCYQYRSADMAKEIKRMQFLQEQYLIICKNDISRVTDLIRLHDEAKQTLAKVDSRQKEIYKERYVRKRKCKTVEDFKEYQIWNLESANELDNLKAEKKRAKSDMHMADVCINENLYTAYGYVDEAEKLDYGAEEVVPMMYNYQKRDITEEFGSVENTDRVVEEQPVDVAEPMLEDEAYDIRGPEYGTYAVSDETDKREFDVEEYDTLEAVTTVLETVINESVDSEDSNVYVNETAEQTIEQRADEIAEVIRKSYTSYDRLSIMDKARIFKFRIDDNRYNLQLHGLVLKELGLNLYGAEVYEDYQSIYEKTMKKAEKQNADDERRYGDKKWERGR